MNDNFLHAQYDVTKKNKIRKFYEENKKKIFLSAIFLLIIIILSGVYFKKNQEKKTLLSDNYIEAKIFIERGDKNSARDILEKIVYENDKTYSVLSLFLILNEQLISDKEKVSNLFDHLLENNKFEKETKYLIIFKKSLFTSNYASETEILETLNPLINAETLWKPHALLLLGDYFSSKDEFLKAREFYNQVLNMKNINRSLQDQAKQQLNTIINE